ncbi:hypothetical protein HNR46_003081 [Haloferula luteola]|uniref:Uncharacterized protein n=1 Tax=Haloferula luteola TaxID=595692 RepID=A0A840V5C6_9BACT|nr:hypothetical protein [Haloferula luteola]MBB5352833.1 hypothetical protein [Haloferula luteola]
MNMQKKVVRFLVIGGFLGLAWVAHELGRRSARAGWFLSSELPASAAASEFLPSRMMKVDSKGRPPLAERVRRWRIEWAKGGWVDVSFERWEGLRDSWNELTNEELAEAYSWLKDERGLAARRLRQQLLNLWLERDPEAACRAARDGSGRALEIAVREWAKNDPESCLAWLGESDVLMDPGGLRERLRVAAVEPLLLRDEGRALEEFLKIPENGGQAWAISRDQVLAAWAPSCYADPALRDRLVEFAWSTGNARDGAVLNAELLTGWPEEDAMGLLTHLVELKDHLEAPTGIAGDSSEVDAVVVAAAIHREYDGPALQWWMERNSQLDQVPSDLVGSWVRQYRKESEETLQWLEDQPASPQRDALRAALIPVMAGQDPASASRQVLAISDPTWRQKAAERLEWGWSQSDPQAAAAWWERQDFDR